MRTPPAVACYTSGTGPRAFLPGRAQGSGARGTVPRTARGETAYVSNLFMNAAPEARLEREGARVPSKAAPRLEMLLTGATLVLLLGSMLGGLFGVPGQVLLAVHLAAYVTGGWWAVLNTAPRLIKGKLDVDFLMLLAALGAALLGHWREGIVLLFLFSLSNTLQTYAMDRSRRAVDSLIKRRPKEATVLRDGVELAVPVEELVIGDRLILRPGEMAATDGAVREGLSEMDESSITGEARAVSKGPTDTVFAGAINGTGTLEVEVTRLANDSTLARIIRLIESAQAQKATTQRVLEQFESYYAWFILVGVAVVILVPVLLGHPFPPAFYRGMVLLVVASPCALVISTPAAILSAIARAARHGILFKGGVYLEKMAAVRVVVFDKTGTLTTGKPGLTDIVLAESAPDGFAEDDLLAYAAALESRSEHLLAKEIVAAAAARELALPAMTQFVALPGRGVHAVLEGYEVWIGGNRLFEEHGERVPADLLAAKARLEAEGKSVLILHRELSRAHDVGLHEAQGGWLGLVALADTMRDDVPATIQALRRLGIARTVMLTGDNPEVAAGIAAQAGIDEYHANLLPEDKVRIVRELEATHGAVMMIGDGVNDAPALAHASVGVAMGAAGSDLALESAPCVLMGEELSRVPFALALSRRTLRIVKANLAFSIAVIVLLAASVFLFTLPMPLGVLGHEGSTLLVCANGLRLLAMKRVV